MMQILSKPLLHFYETYFHSRFKQKEFKRVHFHMRLEHTFNRRSERGHLPLRRSCALRGIDCYRLQLDSQQPRLYKFYSSQGT